MNDALLKIVVAINGILWGKILIVILVGCGIFFTISLKGIQLRKFSKAFKQAFKGFSLKGENAGKDGMS